MLVYYLLQENDQYKGANFYPHDVTKQEIEEATKDPPKIFSPFTVVKRNNKGKLIAVDYHLKYSMILFNIFELDIMLLKMY